MWQLAQRLPTRNQVPAPRRPAREVRPEARHPSLAGRHQGMGGVVKILVTSQNNPSNSPNPPKASKRPTLARPKLLEDKHLGGLGVLGAHSEQVAKISSDEPNPPNITFELSTSTSPPSVKGFYLKVRGKGRVKTKAYRNWLRNVGWEIKLQRHGCVRSKFDAEIIDPKNLPGDVDNRAKAALDALTQFGAIEDDRHCQCLT